MTWTEGGTEMVRLSDAVHPETPIDRPWLVPKATKIALKATSGRKRLNIQCAPYLGDLSFHTLSKKRETNAQTRLQSFGENEAKNPT